jgi:predicted dehydrogenase
MTVRLGVIGAGTHGARYLRHAAHDVPGLRPVALCRRDEAAGRALAAAFGCRYERDPAALIAATDVDAVLVCTPPSSHFALAAAVREAGKALLLEKPMTGTLAEARRLVEIDDRGAGPGLVVAQTLRWNPVIRRAVALWPQLGEVRHVRLAQRLEPTDLAWQRDPAVTVGGSVLLTGVHLFDTVRHVTGREFAEIDARTERFLNPAVEDFFLARARLDDGTYVSLEVSKFGRTRACLLEAVGTQGQLLADYQFGGIRLIRGREVQEIAAEAGAPTLPAVLETLRDTARGAAVSPVPAREGLRTMELVEASYRSALLKRPVAIGEL